MLKKSYSTTSFTDTLKNNIPVFHLYCCEIITLVVQSLINSFDITISWDPILEEALCYKLRIPKMNKAQGT